jgi:hypothetical protein
LLPEAGFPARNVLPAPKRIQSDRTDADRGDAGAIRARIVDWN